MQIKGLTNLNIDMNEKDAGKVIRVLNDYQLKVKKTTDEVIKKQILNGILHRNVSITLGTDLLFEHKLGRTPIGIIPVNYDDEYRIELIIVNNDNSDILVLDSQFYTSWDEYTPTLTNFTLTGDTWLHRIVGDSIDIRGKGQFATTAASAFRVSIPPTVNIDYTKLPSSGYSICGNCQGWDSSAGINYHGFVETYNGEDNLKFTGHAAGSWTSLVPIVWQVGADDISENVSNLPVKNITKKVDIWVF